jgi:hypothetical protein
MTTSNTTIYELDRDDLISAAMRKLGVLSKGQSPDAEDLANGQTALNGLVAEFQTLGMPLWKRNQYSLTLTSNIASYTIGVGQTVNTPFPLKLQSVVVRDSSGSAQEVFPVARTEFNLLNTSSTGKPNQYTYQTFVNSGVLKLWPKPDSAYVLELTYTEPLEGFTAASETPDFPQEWQNALVYGLAVLLAPEYGVPLNDRQVLAKEAEKHLDIAKDFDYENTSVYFQVSREY